MNEELDPADAEFVRRTRVLLEASAVSLPPRTRSRLTRARYAALGQHAGSRRAPAGAARAYWQRWLPAGAVTGAVLAVLLIQSGPLAPTLRQAGVVAGANGDDLELLADRDALALAQDQSAPDADDDYAFYAWAAGAAQDDNNGQAGS